MTVPQRCRRAALYRQCSSGTRTLPSIMMVGEAALTSRSTTALRPLYVTVLARQVDHRPVFGVAVPCRARLRRDDAEIIVLSRGHCILTPEEREPQMKVALARGDHGLRMTCLCRWLRPGLASGTVTVTVAAAAAGQVTWS